MSEPMEVMVSFGGGPWRYALYSEEVEWLPDWDPFAEEAHGIRIPVLKLSGKDGSLPQFIPSPFTLVAPDGSEVEGVVQSAEGVWSGSSWQATFKGRITKLTPLPGSATPTTGRNGGLACAERLRTVTCDQLNFVSLKARHRAGFSHF